MQVVGDGAGKSSRVDHGVRHPLLKGMARRRAGGDIQGALLAIWLRRTPHGCALPSGRLSPIRASPQPPAAPQRVSFLAAKVDDYAKEMGISEKEAQDLLLGGTLLQLDQQTAGKPDRTTDKPSMRRLRTGWPIRPPRPVCASSISKVRSSRRTRSRVISTPTTTCTARRTEATWPQRRSIGRSIPI